MIDPNNDTAVRALGEHLFIHYLPELVPNAAGRYAAELLDERDDAVDDAESLRRDAEREADSLSDALAEIIDLADDAMTEDSGDDAETLELQLADARAEVERLNVALAAIQRVARGAL